MLKDARDFDVIFVEKEVFPYIPASLEARVLPRGVPYFCDMDDAWFHVYDKHRSSIVRAFTGDKIAKLVSGAAGVIAGSGYLYEFAARHNRNVYSIPTVIDLDRYPKSPPPEVPGKPFVVGWIGSHTTLEHLKLIAPVLDDFCAARDARVDVIGAGGDNLAIRNVNRIPWSEASEVENLAAIDVGVMPLPDTPAARGKCALKLIQYMGCWKPVIASPVGENANVVRDGLNGFLAATAGQWLDALDRLYRDRALGTSLGKAGRALVESDYSLAGAAPRLASILSQAASRGD